MSLHLSKFRGSTNFFSLCAGSTTVSTKKLKRNVFAFFSPIFIEAAIFHTAIKCNSRRCDKNVYKNKSNGYKREKKGEKITKKLHK